MTLPIESLNRKPTTLFSLEIDLLYLPGNPINPSDGETLPRYTGIITVKVADQHGKVMPKLERELLSLLTPAEKQQFVLLLDRLKGLADEKLLSL